MTPTPGSRPRPAAGRTPAPPRPAAGAGPPTWFATLILVGCVFALYGSTIGHDYTVDDAVYTTGNRFVQRGLAGVPDILTRGSMAGVDNTEVGLYRPLVLLNFLVEIGLWGNSPHVHHLVNVLLYALTASLLFLLLRRMLHDRPPELAFVVALLFVFHPVHTEVVASIKSRDEILAWLFGVLGFLQLFEHSRTRSYRPLALATVLFLLAMFCKEGSAAFVLVAPLMLYFFTRDDIATITRAAMPPGAALVAYLAVRTAVMKVVLFNQPLASYNNALVAANTFADRLATRFVILGKYLWLLVYPRDLTWDYSYRHVSIVSWGDWRPLLTLVVYLAILFVAVTGLRRRNEVAFGILFYLITLAPVSNFFFLIGATMGERFLYVPSLGFCLATGVLLVQWFAARRSATSGARVRLYGAIGVLLLLYGGRTMARNRDWKDNLTLFTAGVRVSSNSARAHGALGNQLALRGQAELDPARRAADERASFEQYTTMVALNSEDPEGWSSLGTMQMAVGDSGAAIRSFHEALSREPRLAKALTNLGVIYFRRARLDSAAYFFEKSVAADSLSVEALGDLGAVHLVRGSARAALQYFDRALRLEPFKPNVLANRRKAYLLLGDTLSANASVGPASLNPQ